MNILRPLGLNKYVCFFVASCIFISHASANIETGEKDFNIDFEKILKNSKRGRPKLDFPMINELRRTYEYSASIAAAILLNESNQGDTNAMLSLASLYGQGKGLPKDIKKAIFWVRTSANQGNAMAQRVLGTFYKKGKHLPRDLKKAKYWYTCAANQGDGRSKRYLKNLE